MKGLLLFALTKGKALLFGLAKIKTLLSMLVSFGVYATMWGWPFALGFVLSIYVHEIGHVIALQRYGIKATAPMFIPLVGAFVRLEQYPRTRHEDADVGLAGPMAGFAAAIAAYLLFRVTDLPVVAAIARSGAMINVFNLIPVWQLDGSRGFTALTRGERITVAVTALGVAALAHAPEAAIVGVVGGFRAFFGGMPTERDPVILRRFLFLLVGLGFLVHLTGGVLRQATGHG
jgi:Zn-dependent protease